LRKCRGAPEGGTWRRLGARLKPASTLAGSRGALGAPALGSPEGSATQQPVPWPSRPCLITGGTPIHRGKLPVPRFRADLKVGATISLRPCWKSQSTLEASARPVTAAAVHLPIIIRRAFIRTCPDCVARLFEIRPSGPRSMRGRILTRTRSGGCRMEPLNGCQFGNLGHMMARQVSAKLVADGAARRTQEQRTRERSWREFCC